MAKARDRTQNSRLTAVREKATIDHLDQDVYEPKVPEKVPDEKGNGRSSTKSTGVPVEDQVRKEWDPRNGGLPTFCPGMTNPSRLRKRPLEADTAANAGAIGEIDIAGCATIAYP
jgi:hypothetical protein